LGNRPWRSSTVVIVQLFFLARGTSTTSVMFITDVQRRCHVACRGQDVCFQLVQMRARRWFEGAAEAETEWKPDAEWQK
jgi:hypothetical protein